MGLGFRVWGLGFRVKLSYLTELMGLGFRVKAWVRGLGRKALLFNRALEVGVLQRYNCFLLEL